MKIQSLNSYNSTLKLQNRPSFKGLDEAFQIWQDSKPTIRKALQETGDKNIAIIMHGNSFPSALNEDFSIGSPYSNGAKNVVDMFGGLVDKIILGPWGLVSSGSQYSPYNSTLESKNTFFINYKELTTPKWAELLSRETFDEIVNNNPAKDNKINYSYVEQSVNRMLGEAYNNYKNKLLAGDKDILDMNKKLELFKSDNPGIILDSIFEILKNKYGDSDFDRWDKIDKELPILLEQNDSQALQRYKQLLEENAESINKNIFSQFLANEHTKYAPIPYVADKQVAIQNCDLWKLQDIVLDNIQGNKVCLGVPADSYSDKGRCWGMPVFDIRKLFDENNELTSGGKRLFNIYKKIFSENKGGVRIDHFQGIIDPYVCINYSPELEDGAGRLLSAPNNKLLKKYSIITNENIDKSKSLSDINHIKYLTEDQLNKYALFFEKIILDAAKSEGLSEKDIMPEDLGSITKPTVKVIEKYNIGSMKVTEFVNPNRPGHIYRGKNSLPKDFITTGTHDSKPFVPFFLEMSEDKYISHLNMLKEDLNMKKLATKKDRTYGIKLKFAELFIAPAQNVQIFFSHLLGLSDWYNKPGDKNVTKWTLRMPNNFAELYLQNMKKGLAFNPFDALSRALKAKDPNKNKQLIQKLKFFEKKIFKNLS